MMCNDLQFEGKEMILIFFANNKTNLSDDWSTNEMYTRCTMQNICVGIPIGTTMLITVQVPSLPILSFLILNLKMAQAFFSGLGVDVSLLDDQTNSLGVDRLYILCQTCCVSI